MRMKSQNSRTKSTIHLTLTLLTIFIGIMLFPLGSKLSSFQLEELIFHLQVPLKGSNNSVVWDTVAQSIGYPICITTSIWLLSTLPLRANVIADISIIKKHKRIQILPALAIRRHIGVLAILTILAGVTWAFVKLDVPGYIQRQSETTEIFEMEYIDPSQQEYVFPERKRNLVYLFVESMESTYSDTVHGGAWAYNLIPNLTELSDENVSFTDQGVVGGMSCLGGTTWTMGALVGGTSGLPLKLPIDFNSYGEFSALMPGAVTLNNVLAEAGYNQILMIGSEAEFGGRKDYFEQHGSVEIWDLETARATGAVEEDYFNGFWGVEDEKLFQFAKGKLTELAAQEQPFNLMLLTVDTHFYDGYLCPQCGTEWETQNENVISCADRQISDFVRWIQRQEFYEDTAIVIAGDHLSMDSDFFEEHGIHDEQRKVYNCFINSAVKPSGDIGNRQLSILDMFPSTLAALGVTWDGSQLALGVNLFSGDATLAERMGIDTFDEEIKMNSSYYNKQFLYPD